MLDRRLIDKARPALDRGAPVKIEEEINNTDRSAGAMLSGTVAKIYGHAGLEADLEVQDLALDGLRAAGLQKLVLDLADARIVRGVLAGLAVDALQLNEVVTALAAKDNAALRRLAAGFPAETREALLALPGLYGDAGVLDAARRALPQRPVITARISLVFDENTGAADVQATFEAAGWQHEETRGEGDWIAMVVRRP